MITRAQAITSIEFHAGECTKHVGPRGGVKVTQEIWRRSGRTKLWKTRPGFKVPIKHGLYHHSYITESDPNIHAVEDCPLED